MGKALLLRLLAGGALAALLALPAAAAERGPRPAQGTLAIQDGNGVFNLVLRGSVIGRVDDAERLVVIDPNPFDRRQPTIRGWEERRRLNRRKVVFEGEDLRLRSARGFYRFQIEGTGVNISAVGSGSVTMRGDERFADTGVYSLNDAGFQAVPYERVTVQLGAPPGASVGESAPQTILVVEDEASIASFVALYLKNAGYSVRRAATGAEALQSVAQSKPDLIILDLMLPDIDGVDVCRRIRQRSDVPILMLTARDEDVDKIIGLEVGADDYLTKPFNPRELVARVKSVLRRSAPPDRRPESRVIKHGDLTVDAGRREVRVGDEEIQLAPKEFDLLWELLDHRGLVLTRDQLLERVWGYTFAGDTRTVDVHVRQVRRKLGEAAPIVTVWGVGYKVASERSPVSAS